mgnify:FL=1
MYMGINKRKIKKAIIIAVFRKVQNLTLISVKIIWVVTFSFLSNLLATNIKAILMIILMTDIRIKYINNVGLF